MNQLYNLLSNVLSNKLTVKFRRHPWMPECCNPLYNYIMYLKTYFLTDAINKGLVKNNMVAWVDFGFNHGGEIYSTPEEFSITLTDENLNHKIHLFSVDKLDDTPIFEIVRNMHTYIGWRSYNSPIRYVEYSI